MAGAAATGTGRPALQRMIREGGSKPMPETGDDSAPSGGNMIATDKVCEIIALARAWDAKVPPVTPDSASDPIDENMREAIADEDADLTGRELRALIRDLNEDEQAELVALCWIGRGSYGPEDWEEALAEARESRRPVVEYLMGEPMLGDLLADGLAAFDRRCDD
jgi:hypothetical protein